MTTKVGLVKVFGWYDNEWGYTCRLADLAALAGRRRWRQAAVKEDQKRGGDRT